MDNPEAKPSLEVPDLERICLRHGLPRARGFYLARNELLGWSSGQLSAIFDKIRPSPAASDTVRSGVHTLGKPSIGSSLQVPSSNLLPTSSWFSVWMRVVTGSSSDMTMSPCLTFGMKGYLLIQDIEVCPDL